MNIETVYETFRVNPLAGDDRGLRGHHVRARIPRRFLERSLPPNVEELSDSPLAPYVSAYLESAMQLRGLWIASGRIFDPSDLFAVWICESMAGRDSLRAVWRMAHAERKARKELGGYEDLRASGLLESARAWKPEILPEDANLSTLVHAAETVSAWRRRTQDMRIETLRTVAIPFLPMRRNSIKRKRKMLRTPNGNIPVPGLRRCREIAAECRRFVREDGG